MTAPRIDARRPSRPQLSPTARMASRPGAKTALGSVGALSTPGLSPTLDSSRILELRLDLQVPSAHRGFPTQRDFAILKALDDHRYLDRVQIQSLFFRGPRSCQYRLRWLADQGLVHAWRVAIRPGRICSASIFVLSRRGAAALADWLDEDARPLVRRAEHALERRFHMVHQLQANQFFVDLAAAAARSPDLGLYHWVGEHGVEDAYGEGGDHGPIPDGWGRLLTRDREILVHLEWDRGTEQPRRLRGKLAGYSGYFAERSGAEANQVLFVAPTDRRERLIQGLVRHHDDRDQRSCGIWTATADTLAIAGPLSAAWLGVDTRRHSILEMPGLSRSDRPVGDSIGKPEWWLRRPATGASS